MRVESARNLGVVPREGAPDQVQDEHGREPAQLAGGHDVRVGGDQAGEVEGEHFSLHSADDYISTHGGYAAWLAQVFQVLLLEGENVGPDALRNAQDVVITSEEFQAFLARHAKYNPVAENNDAMENSYLLLDEEMRFLNCQGGRKRPGRSIFDVGVEAALDDAGWEPETFVDRGGIFDWGNPKPSSTDW
ncbi:hypothetical protein EVG20_g1412 [Dentipellis fragilis]|uniref:Uncharacterized protein n=1 Tax=Dentipellis fragilis TaxID=205917 RepID=A0A4Y9ZAL5_9AGAM|nr:hypothetical protein EVG20_g1412 [Dentipellis fragilis]